jgi:hypothetical protein
MRFSASLIVLVAPLLALALPVKRDPSGPSASSTNAADILVFQFADVLEQLESQFYSQALSKFQDSDFQAAGFTSSQIPIQLFTEIQIDESSHDSFLQVALQSLGSSPVSGCSFDFSSVLTDVTTMAATARLVENVGVGAYLGGATLIDDPVLLDAAGTILTIEARHQTVLNILNLGSAIPQSFDIALSPSEVLAIAGGFISGCDLGIPANPSLSITNTGTVTTGTQLTFSSQAINGSTDGLFCQMMVGGQPTSIPLPIDQCVVPDGINGPVAIFITSDGQPLVNNVVDRATTQLVAGPTMAFIDTQPQMLGMLARTSPSSSSSSNSTVSSASGSDSGSSSSSDSGSGSSSGSTSTTSAVTSITTQTISPEEAQSIIQSASATATAASSLSTSPSSSSSSSPPPNNGATGPAANGAVTIDGWRTVPASSIQG